MLITITATCYTTNMKTSQRAFTLIEVLVVITVISILLGLTYVSYIGTVNRAAETELTEDLRRAREMLLLDRSKGIAFPVSLSSVADGAGVPSEEDTQFTYRRTGSDAFCLSARSAKRATVGPIRVTNDSGVIQDGGC